MNVYDFETKISKKNGGNVNLIYVTTKGCFIAAINDRSHTMDVRSGAVVFYKTIASLLRNSKTYAKSHAKSTFIVKLKGTDYAKATVTKHK